MTNHKANEHTDKEILEKAIKKAINGGWEPPSSKYSVDSKGDGILWKDKGIMVIDSLMYNHLFAKALWGERGMWIKPHTFQYKDHKPVEVKGFYRKGGKNWQYHLQQMVIADDPIKYLGDNI